MSEVQSRYGVYSSVSHRTIIDEETYYLILTLMWPPPPPAPPRTARRNILHGATHRHGGISAHGDIFATQGAYADYLLHTDDPLSASTHGRLLRSCWPLPAGLWSVWLVINYVTTGPGAARLQQAKTLISCVQKYTSTDIYMFGVKKHQEHSLNWVFLSRYIRTSIPKISIVSIYMSGVQEHWVF